MNQTCKVRGRTAPFSGVAALAGALLLPTAHSFAASEATPAFLDSVIGAGVSASSLTPGSHQETCTQPETAKRESPRPLRLAIGTGTVFSPLSLAPVGSYFAAKVSYDLPLSPKRHVAEDRSAIVALYLDSYINHYPLGGFKDGTSIVLGGGGSIRTRTSPTYIGVALGMDYIREDKGVSARQPNGLIGTDKELSTSWRFGTRLFFGWEPRRRPYFLEVSVLFRSATGGASGETEGATLFFGTRL